MILQSLVRCYDSLAAQGTLKRPGWSAVKVQWGLCLTADGQVASVEMLGAANDKGKLLPRMMFLPTPVKRTSGKAASFLCDNAKYLLGITSEMRSSEHTPSDSKAIKDAGTCFRISAQRHHDLLDGMSCPMAQAILRFFDAWQPEQALQTPALQEHFDDLCKGGNLLFCLINELGTVTEAQNVPEIQAAWDASVSNSSERSAFGRCLVTGDEDTIAMLHPSIKGVVGAQSSGASLVSFNALAFESYGRNKGQGLNAPVGNHAAFAYGEALNYMLREKNYHSLLGSATLVYWAETAQSAYSDCFAALLGTNEDMTQNTLDGVMKAIRLGQGLQWENVPLDSRTPFYILGLSPNASRLSVRFFLQGTFGDFAANLARHQERLNIIRPSFDQRETLSAYSLLKETANPNSRDKLPPSHLVGDLLRAILGDAPYPVSLLTQTELRIHAEHNVSRGKAAILKAWLLKNGSNPQYKEVIDVQLNEQTNYAPYVLGRLFAVLESLQQKANPGINATIMDRYFNAACATPSIVFPTLLKLAQSHLKKLDTGYFIYYDKQMTELCGRLTDSYPARLNLQDQGIFQLGYYHQKQKFFTKKEENSNV